MKATVLTAVDVAFAVFILWVIGWILGDPKSPQPGSVALYLVILTILRMREGDAS